MAGKKGKLLAEADALGFDVTEKNTIAELEELIASAQPKDEAVGDAPTETSTGDDAEPDDETPDVIKDLEALSDPKPPLEPTPVEPEAEYLPINTPISDEVEVDTSGENPPPPEVARGPLPGTDPGQALIRDGV